MSVGFFLQSLLKSLARPFASFGFHFQLNLSQRPRTRLLLFHPFPFVKGLLGRMRNPLQPRLWGAVSRCALSQLRKVAVLDGGALNPHSFPSIGRGQSLL